jgi:hypothetical protein
MSMDLGTGVAGFLNKLANDDKMQELWEREPVAVMENFGLSEDDQVLILEGSIGKIRDKIGDELGNDPHVVCIIIKTTPGPGPGPHH